MKSVSLPLLDADGRKHGELVVSELPTGASLAGDGSGIFEGKHYRYELRNVAGVVRIEPSELFNADDATKICGRIVPGQHVGAVNVVVEGAGAVALSTTIEVVPAKLEQVSEYQQLLSDICMHAAEAVLQGFAASTVRASASARSAELLYQRFAVLASQVNSDQFSAAMGQILANPDVEWRMTAEQQTPGNPYPLGPAFARTFAAAGPRRPWLQGRGHSALNTMPVRLSRARPETTVDTAPNRFIKHVLETWRSLAQAMVDGLASKSKKSPSGPVRRGRKAAQEALEALDGILSDPLFREVGTLTHFPASSQVLQKRAGYRQLLRMFVLVEAGLELPWDSSQEDIYSPSLRTVSALYELWCYLTLVDIVSRVCGSPHAGHVFTPSDNGLSLLANTGSASAIEWRTTRSGRPLEVRLVFNYQFAAGTETWTAPMRPDCSILVRPHSSTSDDSLDIWIHFDAKYRIDKASPIELSAEVGGETISRGEAKSDDLLKMHAYRDGIHRTAGAYILYPGDAAIDRRQFIEMLPGLGAFPLRPSSDGAQGIEAISGFLDKVLDHVADQATQHERDRYWRAQIYASAPRERPVLPPVFFLDRPPADVDVLLGYVRGARHRDWIMQARLYNVRADHRRGSVRLGSRELGARYVLLYEQAEEGISRIIGLAHVGDWRVVDRARLVGLGYPQPRGSFYLVTTLDLIEDTPDWLTDVKIDAIKPEGILRGAPFVVTWLDLMSIMS